MASGATLLTVTPDDCTPDAAIEAFEREDYQIAFQLWLTSATEGNSEAQVYAPAYIKLDLALNGTR